MMPFAQGKNPSRRVGRLTANFRHAAQEKSQPLFPCSAIPYCLQFFVIPLPMPFEVVGQIENRLGQYLLLAKEESNQQPSHTAVAVQKRMNRLKLGM